MGKEVANSVAVVAFVVLSFAAFEVVASHFAMVAILSAIEREFFLFFSSVGRPVAG